MLNNKIWLDKRTNNEDITAFPRHLAIVCLSHTTTLNSCDSTVIPGDKQLFRKVSGNLICCFPA
ncbi:hypothetical protein DPMN_105119 [Dreissena polymorpha]|uniref:Uncharacterized protein n=1 Tax=Dreissena polymorpha TaxID=45954 RepID=A0A9D4K301_DREPO|nr:hypothetical protein DPMN_105119 [Dreissena polymorpha]